MRAKGSGDCVERSEPAWDWRGIWKTLPADRFHDGLTREREEGAPVFFREGIKEWAHPVLFCDVRADVGAASALRGRPRGSRTLRSIERLRPQHSSPLTKPKSCPAGVLRCVWLLELRSEEHTSELQSHLNLVCRLLLEKKKK